MSAAGRILVIGGHEFNRRSGNDAICDQIVELASVSRPRICLLPTASGDPTDQIASFRRSFGERDCFPSAISLFRLGSERVNLRERLLAQDVIYVGGGSLVNLLAIWRAHGLDPLLRECWERGILICGQSAGAMCWFEQGVTRSSGETAVAAGLGLLPGSACVHYASEPERRAFFKRAIDEGRLAPGLGLEDQTAALFEGRRLAETIVAREDAAVWRVSAHEQEASERSLDSREIRDRRDAIDIPSAEIIEFREAIAARSGARGARRSKLGRLD